MRAPTILFAIYFMLSAYLLSAQPVNNSFLPPSNGNTEPEIKKTATAYMGLTVNYSEIDNRDGMIIGCRGGWIVNKYVALGLGGYLFLNGYRPNLDMGNAYYYSYSTEGVCGGFFLEGLLPLTNNSKIAIPVFFGSGVVTYSSDSYFNSSWNTNIEASDNYLTLEPGFEYEFGFIKFIRLAAGFYYRFSTSVDLFGINDKFEMVKLTDKNVMDGLSFGITLKIGNF